MTRHSSAKSPSTAPTMSARRSSLRMDGSAAAGDAQRFRRKTWRASSICWPTVVSSMFTALSSRKLRAGFQLALLPLVFVAGCSKQRAARRAQAEKHLAIAKVFESAEPYTTRALTDSDLNAFLAKNADYGADSAEISNFYHERHNQFAWVLDDSITASAEAFVAQAGLIDVE